jgi:insulysin
MDKYFGTAHMLEHSLFLGSEKYKSLGSTAFLDCIAKYSGSFNAFTEYSESGYHFSSASSGFNECLDIFAHFFIDPTLSEEDVVGELNAVDSEYRKDLPIEYW